MMASRIEAKQTPAGYEIGESSCVSRKCTLVNPNDRSRTRERYVLWFGAYGTTYLMVWANNLTDALDECVDWIAENAPGLLMDEQVNEAYREAIAEGKTEDQAIEHAEMEMTSAGNCGNYLASWEWGIALENPTRAQLLEFVGAR